MKRDCDTIQFENRREISEILESLEKILKEHPEKEHVKELYNELDYMYTYW